MSCACPFSPHLHLPPPPASTYFYRGTKYWKFDNERLKTEPGYPKSILRDFMGCHTELLPDPHPRWPDGDRPPFNPNGDGRTEGKEEEDEEEEEEDEEDYSEGGRQPGGDVDVVVQIDEYTRTMSVVMVLVLLVLLLCILGLIYVIVQMQRKGTPRMLLYCKRSLQEWV